MSLIDNTQTSASCSLGTAFRARRCQLTETFSVKISKYEREGVETAAEEQDLLISEVIRIAIDHYLEEYNKTKRR